MNVRHTWFAVPRPVAGPSLRLFTFPFAGGGARAFSAWPGHLPPEVELFAAQLPGREGRFKETPHVRLVDLVRDLAVAIGPHLDVPYAFFGHSMGALVAFTLARELRRMGAREPQLLMVSGRRAPQLPDADPPIHALPEEEFLQELRELNGTPEAVLQNEELLQLLLPILRADFAVCETYEYAPEAPLSCPIVAFGGKDDADAPEEDIAAWSHQTTGSFSQRMFPGDHFYLLDRSVELPQEVSRRLVQLAAVADTVRR